MFAILITLTILSAASLGCQIYNARKITTMSDAAFQKLTADVLALKSENESLKSAAEAAATASAAKDAQILDLQAQLTAAQSAAGSASDAEVLALDAQIAPPAPETPVTP